MSFLSFDFLSSCLDQVYSLIWSFPLLLLLLGLGVYLTIRLKGIQFIYLPYAFKLLLSDTPGKKEKGDISPFQSLMTALAATLGIGNIAGVATAITVGGWGAIFWMWITALFGMAIKYAEAILAVKYREQDKKGEMTGGPMLFIEKGLGWKSLAMAFAFFGAIDAFGGGNMIQAHSVADVLSTSYSIPNWVTGIILMGLTGITLVGGIKTIGRVSSFLVPFMALLYVGASLAVLSMYPSLISSVFYRIFHDAWTGASAIGGIAGGGILIAFQTGISRGLMTSEAGLGTASIAAAAAKTDYPGKQALISMTGSFIATIVLCTLTALVLGVTGVFDQHIDLNGAPLTSLAFSKNLVFGELIVTLSLVFFAITTMLGWAYYGEKCTEYLIGEKAVFWYRLIFTLIILPATLFDLQLVWKIADVCNGCMAIPNLIGIAGLSSVVVYETKRFFSEERKEQKV